MSERVPTARLSGAEILALVVACGRVGEPLDGLTRGRMSAGVEALDGSSGSDGIAWSPAALHDQLGAAIGARHPDVAIQTMHDCGLLARVLPELDATTTLAEDARRRHKDVWDHTKQVVRQSVPKPAVRWAALLHDIGKVPTRCFVPGGGVTFHRHAEIGEEMFERGPATRIAFAPALRERIGLLIRWHQRPGHYEPSWSDAAVRRFAREVGPALDDLLNLSRADITSQRPGQRKRCLASISALARRVRQLEADARAAKLLPAGLGTALMRAFALAPGPEVGALRGQLQRLCESGEIEAHRQPAYYVERAQALALHDPPA